MCKLFDKIGMILRIHMTLEIVSPFRLFIRYYLGKNLTGRCACGNLFTFTKSGWWIITKGLFGLFIIGVSGVTSCIDNGLVDFL